MKRFALLLGVFVLAIPPVGCGTDGSGTGSGTAKYSRRRSRVTQRGQGVRSQKRQAIGGARREGTGWQGSRATCTQVGVTTETLCRSRRSGSRGTYFPIEPR